jgi:hypothetical protein
MTFQKYVGMTNAAMVAVDAARERLVECIHEFGHVVAARTFGFPVAWVSIDPHFIRNDELAKANECASGNPVAMVLSSHLLLPILQRGHARDYSEQTIIQNYCVQVFAGPLTELTANPEFDPEVAGRDYMQVMQCLYLTNPRRKTAERQVNRFWKLAHDFVCQNFPVILKFSTELYNRQTIRSSEIDNIIAAACKADASEFGRPKAA